MPGSPSPSKRTNDPQARRRKVLDVAARLFQERGYNATAMQDISAAAGVTSGGMHHHFPTKKAIGLAVLRERVGPEVEATWLAPIRAARSTAAGLRAVFGAIQAELDANQAVQGCPLNNLALELSLADPDFRAEAQRQFGQWRACIAGRLRADQTAGQATHVAPDAFATLVVAAYSGAMAMAKADQTSEALKVCGRQLVAELKGRRSGQAR